MTKREWVTRCAQRMRKLGKPWQEAMQEASIHAEMQAERFGASGIAWEKPEDVAERNAK